MNIPIYRAKKIDADEWVEGDLIYSDSDDVNIADRNQSTSTDIRVNRRFYTELNYSEIDPSTLAISFDNGETFDDIEMIVLKLEAYDDYRKG